MTMAIYSYAEATTHFRQAGIFDRNERRKTQDARLFQNLERVAKTSERVSLSLSACVWLAGWLERRKPDDACDYNPTHHLKEPCVLRFPTIVPIKTLSLLTTPLQP